MIVVFRQSSLLRSYLVACLMSVRTSVPFRCARRPQDGRQRRTGLYVVDMHRRKAALVMMRVPERQLLVAVRRAEGVVDIKYLAPGWLHRRAEPIDRRRTHPRRVGLARRIL